MRARPSFCTPGGHTCFDNVSNLSNVLDATGSTVGLTCARPDLCSHVLKCARVHMLLQVEGCDADLSLETKTYCQKKRICSQHMRAECIIWPGDNQDLWRFCFQVTPDPDSLLQPSTYCASCQIQQPDPLVAGCSAHRSHSIDCWPIVVWAGYGLPLSAHPFPAHPGMCSCRVSRATLLAAGCGAAPHERQLLANYFPHRACLLTVPAAAAPSAVWQVGATGQL
jgi:hypothetical protein